MASLKNWLYLHYLDFFQISRVPNGTHKDSILVHNAVSIPMIIFGEV